MEGKAHCILLERGSEMRFVLLVVVAMLALLLVLAAACTVGWLVWGEDPWHPGIDDREVGTDGTRSNRWLDR
jgi:hypothetical protein